MKLRSKAPKVELSVQVDHQFAGRIDSLRLNDVVTRALRAEGWNQPATVGLLITDDETIRELNLRYRRQDSPTDVLAFGSSDDEDGFVSPPALPRHLGDLVLSYPRASDQAAQYGLSIEDEVDRLLVHGLLHLLGYKDYEEQERAQMWERQEAILASIHAHEE